MSRVLDFDPKIRNVQTLVPKNAVSYHASPPYALYVFCANDNDSQTKQALH